MNDFRDISHAAGFVSFGRSAERLGWLRLCGTSVFFSNGGWQFRNYGSPRSSPDFRNPSELNSVSS
jgi:hypothetical protein